MPNAALKPCSYPGCTELVSHGACTKHSRHADYHNQDAKKLYDSTAWKRLRQQQLANEPWCAECLRNGIHTSATEVHHKERHQGDAEKFFSGPFESLCKSCHSKETAREVGFKSPPVLKSFDKGDSSDWVRERVKNSPIKPVN